MAAGGIAAPVGVAPAAPVVYPAPLVLAGFDASVTVQTVLEGLTFLADLLPDPEGMASGLLLALSRQ